MLIGGKDPRSILLSRKNEEREVWDGFRYGPLAAREALISMKLSPSMSSTKNFPTCSLTVTPCGTRWVWTHPGTQESPVR